ncbi:MAG: hypothetical protein CSA29_00460 [Desulfobacterales bacterium]|nr:MAG: hypothetical protein CSA29_00460 [Desulfobacterales bacterium]
MPFLLCKGMTLYAMGLRLRDATSLQVRDILSDNGLVHLHGGKGGPGQNGFLTQKKPRQGSCKKQQSHSEV